MNAIAAMITGIVARPSSPSVRFTALPNETITNAPNAMYNQPRSITGPCTNGR